MKRFFTSVLASLCVLAAMAENFYDRNVKTQFERSDVKVSTSVDALWNKYNDGRGPVTRRVSTQSGYSYLGMGTYTDNFFGGTANVEIWQSNSNSTYYRVVKPYDGITNATGSSYTGADYLDLIVMQPGATLGDITITKSDLVLFDGIYTGEHNSTYDADIWIYHPFVFTSLHEESYWTYNKVLSYQDSGIPSQIQLAPYYYMDGVGGWNNTQYNGVVTIKFPGVELPDPYFVSVTCDNTNLSNLTKADKLKFHATFGNNGSAESYINTIVVLNEQKSKIVAKGDLEYTTFPAGGQVSVDYEYGLDTIQPGNYYATVAYFDWENGWTINSSYLKAMTVKSSNVPVENITLSKTSVTLTAGNTLQLTATVTPTNATNKTVSWTTSNSNVATVSSSGLVTAKTVTSQSTATITCSATDGSGVKATCTVTVTPSVISVQSITLSQTSASLSVGNTLQLSATVLPTNATNKTVSWTTSSSSVATVSSTGLITAISNGTATITCSATDGSGVKATCTVTVSGGYPEPSISAVTCENSSLTQNDELKMTATFYNYGVGGNVKTVPVVMAKDDDLTLIEVGGIVSNYFPASQSTTLSYSLSMTEVPEGEYYASVLFYVESDDEDEEGWYYSSKCLVEITVGPDDCNLKGDVNGDCIVNGTDLVALTNIILGRSATKPAADVNQDGSVNGTDYVVLANIILGRSNARGLDYSTAAGDFAGTSWIEVEPYEISAGQEKEVTIDLFNPDDEITLVQFDLDLPQGLNLKVVDGDYDIDIAGRTTWKNHSLSANATDGIIRFLLASSNNKALSGTEGAIITMTLVADDSYKGEGFALKNILLVTPEEKETKPEDIIPVGIRDIVASTEQSHATIYSISGQRLATPHKGVNILDGKKIVVR